MSTMSGNPTPKQAMTMCQPRERAIWERAARRSGIHRRRYPGPPVDAPESEVLQQPIARRARRQIEVGARVGAEVPAGEDDDLLRLPCLLVGLQGEVGRGEDVGGRHDEEEGRRADPVDVG